MIFINRINVGECIMKKFILTLLILVFGVMSANATTMIHYNNAGLPISVSHGAYASVPIDRSKVLTGSYRPYRHGYSNIARPYRYRRNNMGGTQYGYRIPAYTNSASRASSSYTTISRFDKNYTIRPRRSYVANGVRYYN